MSLSNRREGPCQRWRVARLIRIRKQIIQGYSLELTQVPRTTESTASHNPTAWACIDEKQNQQGAAPYESPKPKQSDGHGKCIDSADHLISDLGEPCFAFTLQAYKIRDVRARRSTGKMEEVRSNACNGTCRVSRMTQHHTTGHKQKTLLA